MVNKISLVAICCILFLLVSCNREMYPVDPTGLTYKLRENADSCFKQDRLYSYPINDSIIVFMYLFRNGAYYSFAGSESQACLISESGREIPYYWGRYRIQNDTLKIQLVGPHREPFDKFAIEEEYGLITSDSTLVMLTRVSKNRIRELNKTYYLMKCDSMPKSSSILDKY